MSDDKPRDAKAGGNGPFADDEARPTFILDTNVLISATASHRELHAVAEDVLHWSTLGRQTYVSGQILREYLVVATRPAESNGLGSHARKPSPTHRCFAR